MVMPSFRTIILKTRPTHPRVPNLPRARSFRVILLHRRSSRPRASGATPFLTSKLRVNLDAPPSIAVEWVFRPGPIGEQKPRSQKRNLGTHSESGCSVIFDRGCPDFVLRPAFPSSNRHSDFQLSSKFRCMKTVSSQQPNFNPTALSNPAS
jgi:hypothetical protein